MMWSASGHTTRQPRRLLSNQDEVDFFGTAPRGPKSLPNGTSFSFIHIPKTSGSSFLMDTPQFMPEGVSAAGNRERSMLYSESALPGHVPITVLRSPWKHVLSQFLECKYDDWGKYMTSGTNFPRGSLKYPVAGFEMWVEHFLEMGYSMNATLVGANVAFKCYNPWNMQARYLSTDVPLDAKGLGSDVMMHYVFSRSQMRPDLGDVMLSLERMPFVGIADLYAPSLCLLRFHTTGTMPADCACERQYSIQIHHERHSVPPHSLDDLPGRVLHNIYQLVEIDVALFLHALKIFDVRAELAAAVTGIRVLCDGALLKLRSTVERQAQEAQEWQQTYGSG